VRLVICTKTELKYVRLVFCTIAELDKEIRQWNTTCFIRAVKFTWATCFDLT